MKTERKKAAPETEAAMTLEGRTVPGHVAGSYEMRTLDVAVALVSPDAKRSFLVISGRGISPLPESTLVFSRSTKPDLWIQASELTGIVKPEHAVTSFLLSPHGQRTAIDELKQQLSLSRDAYWKIFRQRQKAAATSRSEKNGKAKKPSRRGVDAGRNP